MSSAQPYAHCSVIRRGRVASVFRAVRAADMGLGLFLVREIVDAHGGEVAIESAPGQGSTFIVRLPLA